MKRGRGLRAGQVVNVLIVSKTSLSETYICIAIGFQRCRGRERFCLVLALFTSERIHTESDLRIWLSDSDNPIKLRSIMGIGPKTVDYFRILVGLSTSAIDRHLRNFLWLAGLAPKGYREDQAVIDGAADILSIDRANFDHSIWQYMTKRAGGPGDSVCSSGRHPLV